MITSNPRSAAVEANSCTLAGERCADMTRSSCSMPSALRVWRQGSRRGTSDWEPVRTATRGMARLWSQEGERSSGGRRRRSEKGQALLVAGARGCGDETRSDTDIYDGFRAEVYSTRAAWAGAAMSLR